MTKFTKENLVKEGMYVFYVGGGERKFVARFKYANSGQATFMTFLRKNFTVEEYFAEQDAGVAPLKIAQAKGFLLPHIKRRLKDLGYPLTVAGFDQMA